MSATVLAAVMCIAASGRLTGASILDSLAQNDPSPQRSLRWSTLAISWSPAEPISGRDIWETVLEAGGGSSGCVLLAGKAEEARLQPMAGLLLALDAVARGMPELARAEEKAAVAALVARASAAVEVQKARYEQVKRRLDADVIQPAKAHCKAQEQDAKAKVAPIVEDGRARSEALRNLARSWNDAGDQAREIFLLRKMEPIIDKLTDTISGAKIEKMTVIDVGGSSGMDARKMLMLAEQVKEVFGIDVVSKLQEMTATKPAQAVKVAPVIEPKQDPKPEPKQERKLMRRRSRPSDAPAVYNEPPPIAGDD